MNRKSLWISLAAMAAACLLAVSCDETKKDDEKVEAPALSVSPTSFAVPAEEGSYSFTYTVANPAEDGQISCGVTVDWISDLDWSVAGKVSFTVAENTAGESRSGSITVAYESSFGTVTATVSVSQEEAQEQGGGSGSEFTGGLSSLVGTYTAKGMAYDNGAATEQTWTMKIYEYNYEGYDYALIDGLTPAYAGAYPESEVFSALGILYGYSLLLMTQLTGYHRNSDGLKIGYTSCTGYEDGVWEYDGTFDAYTLFNYVDGRWSSDNGEILGAFSIVSEDNWGIVALNDIIDATCPGIVLTKTSDSTETSAVPSAYLDEMARQASLFMPYRMFRRLDDGLDIGRGN